MGILKRIAEKLLQNAPDDFTEESEQQTDTDNNPHQRSHTIEIETPDDESDSGETPIHTSDEETDVTDDDEEDEPSDDGTPVSEVDGIGPTYSDRLEEFGVATVTDLANADAEELAENIKGVSEKRASDWVSAANNF